MVLGIDACLPVSCTCDLGVSLTHPSIHHKCSYPNELFEYLRLVYLTPEDAAGRALGDIDYADPVSLQNELAVFASIEEACTDALEQYSTKEEDDARLINDTRMFNMLPKTQRMAVKHRRSEKRLLKKTAAAVRQQMLNLRSGKRKLRPEEEEE